MCAEKSVRLGSVRSKKRALKKCALKKRALRKTCARKTYGIFFASKIRQIRWEKGQNLELIKVTSFEWSKIGQLELASKCCVHKAMICFNANAWWTNKRLLCELGSFIVNIWVMSNRKWQWNYLHNLIINVITFICIIFEKRSEGGRRPTEQSVFNFFFWVFDLPSHRRLRE